MKGKRPAGAEERSRRGLRSGALISLLVIATAGALFPFASSRLFHVRAANQARSGDAAETPWSPDWASLKRVNGDVAGWLQVEGTSIDLPVVSQSPERPAAFWLKHDFTGAPNPSGCPYLQKSIDPDGAHIMVLGHHLGFSSEMFSELASSYVPDRFSSIGKALWITPEGGSETFVPLCSLKVDESYGKIQRYRFDDPQSLRDWLLDIADDSAATCIDWRGRIAGATRALTLVTCSNAIAGQSERTLTVFVR